VAGALTTQLLEAMPPHSKVTVYGGLSGEAGQILPGPLIFQDKAIDGFWLPPWLRARNMLQNVLLWRHTQKLIATRLKTEIRARYPLREVRQAVQDYQAQMTGGKVLLIPDM
jgi:NADPH:quinone reductase-like Zn-dependent oxidoreductase